MPMKHTAAMAYTNDFLDLLRLRTGPLRLTCREQENLSVKNTLVLGHRLEIN